ncbi:MAG: pyridoxal-phosphate dependent enzyme [Dehalococcoidia bacterium]|nr:pyridoxal-phosphate dependent enzyme [Dehalococcoidia bacterium]
MIPLFEQYPLLQEKLANVPLCEFPTPVQRLERLGDELGVSQLYIKRDDLSGKLYGGNKPRKLEFLLGDALRSKAKEVMTFGCAGSNHALATAIYARQVGLKSISMLMPQPNAHYVRRNLLMSHCCGAELHLCGAGLESVMNKPLVYAATTYQRLRHWLKTGRTPYIIPPGGSSPLGDTGIVNAAFELRKQITSGEMPEPEYIYVACGTMGTAAGLILGLRAAKLGSRVVSVAVYSEKFINARAMIKIIDKINSLLCSLDASFPRFEFSETDVDIRHDYFGKRYALFTDEGMEAISLMKKCEGIKLDGTYTGKALAALKYDAKSGRLRGKAVLFWNTLNSRDFSDAIANVDYHDLPPCFHRYFEEEVQPLDRDD